MTSPWIAFRRSSPRGLVRLFCLPYAGAGAAIFRAWSERLPAWIDVCPIELPGRGTRSAEPPASGLPALAAALGEALVPALDLPYAVFGHSAGALVGFELLRWLRRRSAPAPLGLFVSAHRGPRLPYRGQPARELDDEQLRHQLVAWGGTPPELVAERELLRQRLDVLRRDLELSQGYVYRAEPPLATPIFAFAGAGDIHASAADVALWESETVAGLSLRRMPGEHFFLHTAQPLLLAVLEQELRGWLEAPGCTAVADGLEAR